MKIDKLFTLEEGPSQGPGNCHINSFITKLRAEGYAERTMRKKKIGCRVLRSVDRWEAAGRA